MRERGPNVTLTQAKDPSCVLKKLRKHVLATSKSNHIWYLIGYDSWGDNIANDTGSVSQLMELCVHPINGSQKITPPASGRRRESSTLILAGSWCTHDAEHSLSHLCRTHTMALETLQDYPLAMQQLFFCFTNITRSSTYTTQISSTKNQRT